MKFKVKEPTTPHKHFALLPVMLFDRTTGEAHIVWLQSVVRRMVSIQGAPMWVYSYE